MVPKKGVTGNHDIDFLESQDKVDGVKDDTFIALRSELDQIRFSRTMYVGDSGVKGAFHLFKEVFNNALDEMNNPENASKNVKRIYVSFSEKLQKFTVADEGRGIPMDMLVDSVMTKHFTTKSVDLSKIRNKKQTGLHGVGNTVVAALSDLMSVTTYRGKRCKTIVLVDGELSEPPVKELKDPQFGTVVELVPSQKYLGEFHIDEDMVENFMRNMSYLVDPDFELILNLVDHPKKQQTIIYKAKGLKAAVEYMSSSLEFSPVEVMVDTEDFTMTVAFSYDRNVDETVFTSFCNYVITDFGGTHEQIAQQAIWQYLTREAKRLDPNSKQEITFDDCKSGLIIAVNLEHIAPAYESQNKERVSNKFSSEDKKQLVDGIYMAMNVNQGTLKKVISYLRNVAKARQESHKIKGVTVKKQTTFLDDAEIAKFFPVTDRNSTGYRELYLCEGDSAAGGVLNCCNRQYQAVMTVNGVTDNVHDCSITQVLQKPFFKNLITVLGCGIGKDFDITKLKYNKIIICTDKDIDGHNITSLLLCFFLIFMPELIFQGKVYKAIPPLYLMDIKSMKKFASGKREWLYDKYEYYDLYHNAIADISEIELEVETEVPKGKSTKSVVSYVALPKKQFVNWLNMNSEYLAELVNLGKKAACNMIIAEYVCYFKAKYPNAADFRDALYKEFPEMNYDAATESLIGSWNGNYFSLICDRLFMRSAARFMPQMLKNQTIFVRYRLKNEKDKKFTRCTIGEFLALMELTVKLIIEQRYKGVGEVTADLLFATTMNPKYRKLYCITIEDMNEALATFELLHGKSSELRERRRQLLDNAQISYMDIDN